MGAPKNRVCEHHEKGGVWWVTTAPQKVVSKSTPPPQTPKKQKKDKALTLLPLGIWGQTLCFSTPPGCGESGQQNEKWQSCLPELSPSLSRHLKNRTLNFLELGQTLDAARFSTRFRTEKSLGSVLEKKIYFVSL